MKSVFVLLALVSASSAFASSKDCRNAVIRKAANSYANLITHQWACASATHTPFEQRDSATAVKNCLQNSVMYKEQGAKAPQFCVVLGIKGQSEGTYIQFNLAKTGPYAGAMVPDAPVYGQ